MKMKNVRFVALVAVASSAELVIAQPAWAAIRKGRTVWIADAHRDGLSSLISQVLGPEITASCWIIAYRKLKIFSRC